MSDTEVTAPSIEELEAKQERLAKDVDDAKTGLETAKSTFADAAKSDPTAVETLLELANAVKAAEGTVSTAERAVNKCDSDIAGIRYQEQMAGVTATTVSLMDAVRDAIDDWRTTNVETLRDAKVTGVTITATDLEAELATMSVKPTGTEMPKPPSTRGTGGPRGPRGTRNVTFTADGVAPSRTGETVSCRDYVAACGDEAAPAAQADLAGTWEGSPVSYTNEAKRLAAKKGDTFA
jgi:hypothetical protein